MRRRLAVVLVAVALATTGCRSARATASPGQATVVAVIDGDTIKVHLGGATETVRLLGIDTPETVHPTKPVQCYGPEASHRTKELLPPGSTVRLERDIEARDRYGRLLAYVRRSDGTFVNQALLEEGYARTLTIAPNGAYSEAFAAAARGAEQAGRGLWGSCTIEGGEVAARR